ncbi:MAG: tetratricopeptide repeat protein, partial [Pseudomonadota bacterium]
MKRFWTMLFAVVLATPYIQCTAFGASMDKELYERARSSLESGNPDAAARLLTEAIRSGGENYHYYNDRGVAYKRMGNQESALADYNKSLRLKPDYANALNNRGMIYLDRGMFKEAVEDFTKAIESGGSSGKVLTNRGFAYARLGDHENALRDYRKAVALKPTDNRTFRFMADSLEQTGEPEKAVKMYQLAVGIEKDTSIRAQIEERIAAMESGRSKGRAAQTPNKPAEDTGAPAAAAIAAPRSMSTTPKVTAIQAPNNKHQAKAPSASASESGIKPLQRSTDTPAEPVRDSGIGDIAALDTLSRSKAMGKFSKVSGELYLQGRQLLDASQPHKALIRLEDALHLARRNKDAYCTAWCLLEIGRVHAAIGDHLKSQESFTKALKLFGELKAGDEQILVLTDLAASDKASGNQKKAAEHYLRAGSIAMSAGHSRLAEAIDDLRLGRSRRPPEPRAKADPVRNQTPSEKPKVESGAVQEGTPRRATAVAAPDSGTKPVWGRQKEEPAAPTTSPVPVPVDKASAKPAAAVIDREQKEPEKRKSDTEVFSAGAGRDLMELEVGRSGNRRGLQEYL